MKHLLTTLAAICVGLATPAAAAPYTFTAASGTASPFGFLQHDWSDPANWSPAGFPTSPPLDLGFPGLPAGLLTPWGAVVVGAIPMPALHDLSFAAPHRYAINLTNCVAWQISGTLTEIGPGDAFIDGSAGRLNLASPTLGGSGVGLLTVIHPESITGPITVTSGNHEWQIDALAFCSPGSAPPVLTLTTLTANGGNFRLLSDVNLPFTGAFDVNAGAIVCVKSLSGGSVNLTAASCTIASGGTLNLGSGVIAFTGITVVGTLGAGCSVATATIVGDLTYTSTATMQFELGTPGVVGGTENDLIIVTGNLTLDGTLVVDPQAGFGPGVYRLFNFTGTLTDNGVTIGSLPAGLSATLDTTTPGQVNLIVTPVNQCGPLSILRASANIIVQWTGGCQLQSTASLDEPIVWTPLPGAASPATFPITAAKQFFRTVALDGSCSPNTVGYVNHTLADGQRYLLANPLNGANNNLNTILPLPVAADGTTLIRWNLGIPSAPITYTAGGGWDNNVSLNPGEGFFFDVLATGGLSITFVGEVPQGNLVNPLPGGLSLKSSFAPLQGQLGGTLGFPAEDGDVVSVWNATTQIFKDPFTYLDGFGWMSSNADDPGPDGPVISVGTGFVVQRGSPGNWIRTFNVNQCAPQPPCTNELRFACMTLTNVLSVGGTNDNFAGPEPASPSAGLAGRFSTLVGFDECPVSAIFAHTFSNLPPCITGARLCVRLKACGGGCADDGINLAFVGPASQILPPGYWQHYLGTGNPGPGLINDNWCNATNGETICLDLANLPPSLSGGPTNLIAAMNQHGFLDFTAGEESAVDWITLEITSCCCHADIEVANDPGLCSAVVQYVPPTAIGGCSSNVTVNCTPPSGVFPVGTTTVTCAATNDAGQSAQCTFRVTVRDTEPPVIVCPEAVTSTNCLIPQLLFTASDNCTASNQLVFTQFPPANTSVAPGSYVVITRACDSSGNCFDCDTLVTVTACVSNPPCTNELRFACAVSSNYVFSVGGTNDNFAGPEPASPSAGLAGRFSTLVGFDECPASAVFAHTFSNLPPCITAARVCVRLKPCDLVNCGDEGINFAFVGPASQLLPPGYWVHYLGTGNPGPGLINSNWCTVSGGETFCLDLANLPPTFSGGPTDLIAAMNQHGFLDFIAGNESAVDWITLEITSCCCHEDIEVANDPGLCSAVVQYVPPTAIGGCSSNVTVNCTPPSGVFPVGTTTVTCLATNDAGQSAQCIFRVTVRDTEPPQLVCDTNVLIVPLEAGCQLRVPQIRPAASDNCTPSRHLIYTQTPAAGTLGSSLCTNVIITVTDAAGNSATCVRQVCGQDRTPPQLTCPSGAITVSNCQVPSLLGGASATDNCTASNLLRWSQSPGAGTPINVPTWVAIQVADATGKYTSCRILVTPVGGPCLPCVPPVIVVQPPDLGLPAGAAAIFGATAAGTGPLTYQWYRGFAPLGNGGRYLGVNTSKLRVAPITTADAGRYYCVVSNLCGSARTRDAWLYVWNLHPWPVAAWSFADPNLPFAGDVGAALVFSGDTNQFTVSTTEDLGLPHPAGRPANVLSTPGFTGGATLTLPSIMPSNVTSLANYSVVMDVFVPTGASNQTHTLFANRPGASNSFSWTMISGDPLPTVPGIPGRLTADGVAMAAPSGQWNRVALVVSTEDGAARLSTYLNGAHTGDTDLGLAGEPVKGVDVNLDQIPGGALIFTPRGGGTNSGHGELHIAAIQLHGVALPPETLASLGHPNAGLTLAELGGRRPGPRLEFQASAGSLTLAWPDGSRLESAITPSGPWIELPNVVSPYTAPLAGPAGFLRVQAMDNDGDF